MMCIDGYTAPNSIDKEGFTTPHVSPFQSSPVPHVSLLPPGRTFFRTRMDRNRCISVYRRGTSTVIGFVFDSDLRHPGTLSSLPRCDDIARTTTAGCPSYSERREQAQTEGMRMPDIDMCFGFSSRRATLFVTCNASNSSASRAAILFVRVDGTNLFLDLLNVLLLGVGIRTCIYHLFLYR